MAAESKTFLQEGIKRYAEACATIAHYQSEVEGLARGVLEAHGDWGRFQPDAETFDSDRSRSVSAGEHWMEAYAAGVLDRAEVLIGLGVFWGSPKDGDVIAYCNFQEGPDRLKSFAYKAKKKDGYITFEYYGRTQIARRLTTDSDLELELRLVLEEFLRASGIRP